ncbi:6-hydroxymethylpterin diphosphokinase MptE-like protein [Methanohalophilus sp.]|uniref:6-hydroxymethylpterin diphosphokinase MptE-like protein n=1 Tax=Methanohalophilus sp. TaxID=1966352 RepID=UPI002614081E|nr:6-hydroxymethylpterin diphosphokinase MptE-like protein [Methanohalophilus sp.]MDK2891849.1 2-amino-4-hydroxy-6-hydroxymethyldihydropteridine diphosphokinase [Methanohalophilus sp.]
MEFNDWKPIYKQILEDFGFSKEDDESAALLLSTLLIADSVEPPETLMQLIHGKNILVCGNAPTLKKELDELNLQDYIIIAADGATSVLVDREVIPAIIVTDLDGDVEKEIEANIQGAIMVVHAHGDNTDKLLKYVPLLSKVIGTTQSEPFGNIYNFGGFTDGDRAAYLAHHFGASSITLAGFDFDDESVREIKKKKLQWAYRLLQNLV